MIWKLLERMICLLLRAKVAKKYLIKAVNMVTYHEYGEYLPCQ